LIQIARLAGLLLSLATILSAGSVTYTYVGGDFTAYAGADNSDAETNISVSFTVPSLLVDFNDFVTPTSFEISDGSATLTDQSQDITNANTGFYLTTDSAGLPYIWSVGVFQTNASGYLWLITQTSSDTSENCGIGDLTDCFSGLSDASVGYNSSAWQQPGWTVEATTPEPSSVSMAVLGGLFGLAGSGLKSRSALSRWLHL
jgi:hypothetical protein